MATEILDINKILSATAVAKADFAALMSTVDEEKVTTIPYAPITTAST